MSTKSISVDYVTALCARIEQGETPQKNNDLSPKEFIRQMLPHVKKFLEQGYTYKEIAEFLGHISSGDLKKAVTKADSDTAVNKKTAAGQKNKKIINHIQL
jgi:hypothetical protein